MSKSLGNPTDLRLGRSTVLRASKYENLMPLLGGAAAPENLTEALDTLYATTWQLMRGEAIDQIFTATPFWFWLTSKDRLRSESGGKWIGIDLLYGKNTTVASLGKGGQVDITPTDGLTTAKYDWKLVAGSVVRFLMDDNMNRGQAQILSKVKADLVNLKLSMIDTLETMVSGLGNGNGGKDLNGIQSIVKNDPTTNPAAGAIGGIDAVANTWWRNQARAWSTVGMPVGDSDIAFNLRKLYNATSVGNDHPSLILTDVGTYEKYEASLTVILAPVDKAMNDLGFESIRYKGGAIVFGDSMPTGEARMLNERYLEFIYDPASYFTPTPWKSIPNQLDRVMQVVTQGELVTSNRRMHGVLTGIPA